MTQELDIMAGLDSLSGETTKEKKSDIPTIVLSEERFPNASAVLKEFTEVKNEEATLATRHTDLEEDIKSIAVEVWEELYLQLKTNPTSVNLCGEKGGKVLFSVKNAYKEVPASQVERLRKTYGNDIVTADKEYKLNLALLPKYGAQIIAKLKEIPLEKGENLLEVKTKYKVTAGTINRLVELKDKGNFMTDFQPTLSLK